MLPLLSARPEQVERALKSRYSDAMSILQPKGKELDLLIVILPDSNGSLYGNFLLANEATGESRILKYPGLSGHERLTLRSSLVMILSDVDAPLIAVVVCFCLPGDLKRICETELGLVSQCCLTKHVFRMSKQYLANVALKINVKVGP